MNAGFHQANGQRYFSGDAIAMTTDAESSGAKLCSPAVCSFCGQKVDIKFYDRRRNLYCGPACRSRFELEECIESLKDAVRLIEHGGGNSGCQRKALDLVGH